MPYLKRDAPAHIPPHELLESLLSIPLDDPENPDEPLDEIRPLQELTEDERQRVNLVRLAERTKRIEGDPYGTWQAWAGNLNHPEDESIFTVLVPLLDQLIATEIKDNDDITAIRKLLEAVPRYEPAEIARVMADRSLPITTDENEQEIVVIFTLRGFKIRLMVAKDLDVTDAKSYNTSNRAKLSAEKSQQILHEETMPIYVQQYLMARLLRDRSKDFQDRAAKANEKRLASGLSRIRRTAENSVFAELRALAREEYWLVMSKDERAQLKEIAQLIASTPSLDATLSPALDMVKVNWYEMFWKGNHNDPDFFENFLRDQTSARSIWLLAADDIFIVVDKHRKIVAANVEKLCQLLFGEEVHDLLDRAIDLWAFYCPLPFPATKRHVVDDYIRRLHPELDPAKATVETLANAKMAVAHFGCWSLQNDPQGRMIRPTWDTVFGRCSGNTYDSWFPRQVLPKFSRAVFGKVSAMIRFLLKPLDSEYYQECVDIFESLPGDVKMPVEEETFHTLFVLGINGYTQRHRDTGDIRGGLAGLVTLGRYKGANLCLPQLGLKVPYTPGSCAVLRGNGLDHLVEDYTPPRWFVIGTNHEPAKKHAWRKLGRAPELPPKVRGRIRKWDDPDYVPEAEIGEDGQPYDLEAPCFQWGGDDDEHEIEKTDEGLHGPGALPLSGVGIEE